MQPDSDDDAWRAIVENYGDRADLGTETPDAPEASAGSSGLDDLDPPEATPAPLLDEERFVPGSPELPAVAPDRLAAWSGVFGAPAVLLIATVLGIGLPGWVGYALVAWFVGGFGYLVARMPAGPRDPGDDGARV
ncbi:hypothetical protein [Nocardioides sp.]|uniref:hypothetical protein n=1 Tax=Nocardioides sp. TaxID=35761 RepID=UPI003563A9CE